MATASVKVDDKDLKVLQRNFSPKKVARIIKSESGKTATGTRTKIVQFVRTQLKGISAKELKQRNVRKIQIKGGYGVYAEGYRIPLIRLKAKELKRGGVSYLKVGGGRKTIREAFFGTSRKRLPGQMVVFARKGRESHPIGELKGPSVPQILLGESGKVESIRRFTEETFRKKLASRIEFELNKKS